MKGAIMLPPIVGIDIGKESSEIQIIDSSNQPYGKTIHMKHTHTAMVSALHHIQKLKKELGSKPVIVMEATGHYFRITFYLFYNAGFEVALVNPIQTASFANIPNLRRAKTDKIDAKTIALLYRVGVLRIAKVPSKERIRLKGLCRDYWDFVNQANDWKRKLTALRDQIFLLYEKVFSNSFGHAALSVFLEYPTPEHILNEKTEILAKKIKELSRKSLAWAEKKVLLLKSVAKESPTIPGDKELYIQRLNSYARIIAMFNKEAVSVFRDIKMLVQNDPDYKLLLTIPGIGPITAATILGELGEFKWFKSSGEIVAFAGIDPKVFESGKFKGSRVHMSKRGTPYLRLVLYIIASSAVLAKRSGKPANPVLAAYYRSLRERGKPHKVAIGACMRKMVEYIFATLRDRKEFEVRQPTESSKQSELKATKPLEGVAFPVYDEQDRVISYAMEPVPISRVLDTIMKNLKTR